MITLLVLVTDDMPYSEDDLVNGLRLLQERAEHKDDEFFTRRGLRGARDFLQHYSRFSALRLVTPDAPPILRLQPQARHPLPPDLATLLRR